MALIGTLVSFSPSTTIVSADVNSNFSDIRTAVNNTALMTDVARTITVTNVWSVAQTFSLGATFASSITVASGIRISTGGLHVTAGNIAIGALAALTSAGIYDAGTRSGATTEHGYFFQGTFSSGATTSGNGIRIIGATTAASYTMGTAYGVRVDDWTKGAGSTITNQIAFYAAAQTQGSANYGVYVDQGIATGNAVRIAQTAAMTDAAVKVLGGSLTGSTATSIFHLSQLWNTTGAPTAILCNVTNTASDAASLLLDLQTGGTSRFKVGVLGNITIQGNGTSALPAVQVGAGTQNGLWNSSSTVMVLGAQGSTLLTLDGTHPDAVLVSARFVVSGGFNKVFAGTTLATSATIGYMYLPTVAATATGTPASETGGVALAYDSAANRIMIYNGSWRSVAVT